MGRPGVATHQQGPAAEPAADPDLDLPGHRPRRSPQQLRVRAVDDALLHSAGRGLGDLRASDSAGLVDPAVDDLAVHVALPFVPRRRARRAGARDLRAEHPSIFEAARRLRLHGSRSLGERVHLGPLSHRKRLRRALVRRGAAGVHDERPGPGGSERVGRRGPRAVRPLHGPPRSLLTSGAVLLVFRGPRLSLAERISGSSTISTSSSTPTPTSGS